MRSLAVVHLLGNALLLWLGYYWLGLGETRASTLLWSALVAALLLALTCELHGAAFRRAFVPLRRLLLLMAAALVLLAVYMLLARWAAYSPQPAFKIASYLTLKFRKPVKPAAILAIFNGALWLVRWMLIPVLALPVIASFATGAPRRARKPLYFVEVPALLVCAVWLPLKLLSWVPGITGFGLQMFSFSLRASIAYLLFVAGWLALEVLTSGGNPFATQRSTVPSP